VSGAMHFDHVCLRGVRQSCL